MQSLDAIRKGGMNCVLLPYFYMGKWGGGDEGEMKMKKKPKIIVMGDVKRLATRTAESLSYKTLMLSVCRRKLLWEYTTFTV